MIPRRVKDWIAWGLCGIALVLVMTPAVATVGGIFLQSAGTWHWSLLTTPTSGIAGGLENAWMGTLVLMGLLLVVVGPIGVLAGLYLAEFSSPPLTQVLRTGSEVLAGLPSIVVGYVIYLAIVIGLGWSFSTLAGVMALAIMVVPYVMKTTEATLRQVPTSLREGGAALGLPTSLTIRRVLMPLATPGIMTGLVVAEAIGMGETAPLLYTAGWSNALPSTQLVHRPIGYLTYVVWTYINQPYQAAHDLAYSAALVLLVFLLIAILIERLISWWASRYTGRFQT